jgi:hypothetical protein
MEAKVKPTKKEMKVLKRIIAERMKNLVYMKAEYYADSVLNSVLKYSSFEKGEDEIKFVYKMNFLVNDFIEILGGIRRNGKKGR